MKLLDGKEIAGFIQERQAANIRALKARGTEPKLAIIHTNPGPVVDSYMRLKQAYGEEIGAIVDVVRIEQSEALDAIKKLNNDEAVHGIIVQIPLPNPEQTDEILCAVSRSKDVDGLAAETDFDPATPMAINWLLAGYNTGMAGKNIVIVGQGRLVGRPLAKLWQASGLNVEVADKRTPDLAELTRQADILVSATGSPGLIKKEMVKSDAIIVDAGVATDSNDLVGDIDDSVRELDGITITPKKGGVGPLTVSALFENVIRAAGQKESGEKK